MTFKLPFCGKSRSPLSGTSVQPFLETLVLLFWILGTLGFPHITTFRWMVTHPCSDPDCVWLTPGITLDATIILCIQTTMQVALRVEL